MIDVILDVDTGVDDALAILFALAHPEIALRAVTCVAGNTKVDQVVLNTLAVLEIGGGIDVPVGRGAEHPLLGRHRAATEFHGSDGLGDLGLRPAGVVPVVEPAVALLRRAILSAARPVTLVCLGPLTNLACLLLQHPEVVGALERIVCMVGSLGSGNATPVAEFNAWQDPEAAAVCFASGAPITMYGLEVFSQVEVEAVQVSALLGAGSTSARLAGRLLGHVALASTPLPVELSDGRVGIGDAGALCSVVEPDALTTRRYPVSVELAGTYTRGQTVVDRRLCPGESELHGTSEPGTPLDVAVGVDAQRLAKVFFETLVAH